jgi:hypothetical protein
MRFRVISPLYRFGHAECIEAPRVVAKPVASAKAEAKTALLWIHARDVQSRPHVGMWATAHGARDDGSSV